MKRTEVVRAPPRDIINLYFVSSFSYPLHKNYFSMIQHIPTDQLYLQEKRMEFRAMQTWHQLSASRKIARPASQIWLPRLTGQHVEQDSNRIGQSVIGQFSRVLAKNNNSKLYSNYLGHALTLTVVRSQTTLYIHILYVALVSPTGHLPTLIYI